MSRPSRLTLVQKLEIIQAAESKSQVAVARDFEVSRKTVQNCLKRKADLITAYNEHPEQANKKKRTFTGKHAEIDGFVWQWYKSMRDQNETMKGKDIQAKALEIAEAMGLHDFKASCTWLVRFKARHSLNIAKNTEAETAETVDVDLIGQWMEKVGEIVSDYAPENIYDFDETVLVYRATPDRMRRIGPAERLTVCLMVNMKGAFERPLVIGTCLREARALKSLPVTWRNNDPALMTSALFEEAMEHFNEKMAEQGRNVLVFLDEAPCHPSISLSNVKFVYFPADVASHVLQPSNQGIIRAFKRGYRDKLVRRLLCDVDSGKNASELARTVTIFKACHWIAKAVDEIQASTVRRSFANSGIVTPDHDSYADSDVDHSADEDSSLADVMRRWAEATGTAVTTYDDFVTFDDGFPTSAERDVETALLNPAPELYTIKDEVDRAEDIVESRVVPSAAEVVEYLDCVMEYALHVADSDMVTRVHELTEKVVQHASSSNS